MAARVALALLALSTIACHGSVRRADDIGARQVEVTAVTTTSTTEPTDPVEDARLAVVIDPDSADAHIALGDALSTVGRPREALVAYQKAEKLAPKQATTSFRIGLSLQALGEYDDALAAYRQAAAGLPESAWIQAAIALVQLRSGDRDAALDQVRVVRRLDADLADGLTDIIAEEEGLTQS